MQIRFPQKVGNSLSTWEGVSFSRVTLAEFRACLLSRRLLPVGTKASGTTSHVIIWICPENWRRATDSTISWPQTPAGRLAMNSTVKHSQPSGHYMNRQFNIQQFYVLPTQCVYVFCVDLRTNSDYFTVQHWLIGFYNWDGACLLRSTFYILRSAHTLYLCVLCGSENKYRLFHCTALTGWCSGAFANCKKRILAMSCLSLSLSVYPSVRKEQLRSRWTNFQEIWHFTIFRKSVDKFSSFVRTWHNNNNNNLHCTWRPIHIFHHISLSSS